MGRCTAAKLVWLAKKRSNFGHGTQDIEWNEFTSVRLLGVSIHSSLPICGLAKQISPAVLSFRTIGQYQMFFSSNGAFLQEK
jgi:hypothetical protein